MAVSGKKLSDFSGSINVSSAEDFDHSCEPCLTAGQHIQAHGYCVDCREYLCKTCFTYHQRTKASKDHQLLDKDNLNKKGIPKPYSALCTEKCHLHTDEVIKFFCLQHEELACHDCVSLDHRTCDLDYIPDKCADIRDSEEFKMTEWLLNMKMAEVNYVMKTATKRRKEIDKYSDDLIKGIDEFQKEVNECIQQIRKDVLAKIAKKYSLDKQTVQGVLDSCTTISSDISKLQTKLQASKTTKQNGQLYIAIKQAMSKLTADEIKKSEEELDKTNLQYKFEPNPDLQALLSQQEGFGKLSLSTTLVSPWNKVNLTEKGDINIRTKSDESPCHICGCAVLSSNKLVLADAANDKLKVLDTLSNLVVAEKKLHSSPFDVTVLPQDQIAVTLPYEKQILIMTTGSNLSAVHTIPVKGRCTGISYHQDYLYTVCRDTNTVVKLDTKGTVYSIILLDTGQLEHRYYIVVSEDSRLIYISYPLSGSIVSITLQGERSAVYKNLPGSLGMTVLDDGSLLVCCGDKGTIHHISADMKQNQEISHAVMCPISVCYNHHKQEVYIGGYKSDKVKVFSLQYV